VTQLIDQRDPFPYQSITSPVRDLHLVAPQRHPNVTAHGFSFAANLIIPSRSMRRMHR
jgi:hypothetical protein